MLLLHNLLSALVAATLVASAANLVMPLRDKQLIGWFDDAAGGEAPTLYNPRSIALDDQCDGLQLFGQGIAGFLSLAGFCVNSGKGGDNERYFSELNLNGCFENDDGQLRYSQDG